VDRILRGNVVDFILLHWYDKKVTFQIFGKAHIVDLIWPAFNVADSCITIGVVWLLATTLFAKKEVGSTK
jgi:lipoprotein signal peptidase